MANRKEYEMLFQLNAQLGSSYNSTFSKAQQQVAAMQKEIQALSKTQSDSRGDDGEAVRVHVSMSPV